MGENSKHKARPNVMSETPKQMAKPNVMRKTSKYMADGSELVVHTKSSVIILRGINFHQCFISRRSDDKSTDKVSTNTDYAEQKYI